MREGRLTIHAVSTAAFGSEDRLPVSVVVVDDDPLAREALPSLLAGSGIVVSATTADVGDAEELLDRHNPAVALLGISFADQVEEVTRRIARNEQAPPMLIRTDARALPGIEQSRPDGVQGAVSRRASLQDLARAIRTVAAGGTWFETPSERPARGERRSAQLSKRERRVLVELARGGTTEEIADCLHLTTHTVRSHIRNILRKLDAKSRAHAVAIACSEGSIDLNL